MMADTVAAEVHVTQVGLLLLPHPAISNGGSEGASWL